MIRFDNVRFTYGGGESARHALSGVSLSVEPGSMVAVLGANGSGKSTLARLSNGLLLPESGQVTVDGIATDSREFDEERRGAVGFVFQNPDDQLVATSVEDDVAFGPENMGLDRATIRARVDGALAAVGLTGLERREPHLLSGGQKQRLAIAGALALEPRYLVLDEPTAMLDPTGREEVRRAVTDLVAAGHGVLMITHDLAEALSADSVIVLAEGALAFEGSPSELLGQSEGFVEWALEVPPLTRFALALKRAGGPDASTASTAQELEAALWG